jgi:hypothetical protein
VTDVKTVKPFSKEIVDGGTVSSDEDGCRSGFTDYITETRVHHGTPIPNMAGTYPDASDLKHTTPGGNPAHPEFINREDDGIPDVPAPFSKKNIPGGPR